MSWFTERFREVKGKWKGLEEGYVSKLFPRGSIEGVFDTLCELKGEEAQRYLDAKLPFLQECVNRLPEKERFTGEYAVGLCYSVCGRVPEALFLVGKAVDSYNREDPMIYHGIVTEYFKTVSKAPNIEDEVTRRAALVQALGKVRDIVGECGPELEVTACKTQGYCYFHLEDYQSAASWYQMAILASDGKKADSLPLTASSFMECVRRTILSDMKAFHKGLLCEEALPEFCSRLRLAVIMMDQVLAKCPELKHVAREREMTVRWMRMNGLSVKDQDPRVN